jgi:tryptophan synthase alpha chain
MRVRQAFANGKAVMAFLTCGYPSLDTTEEVIYALDRAGLDLIVLGVPFSDPAGECPLLRKASEHVLNRGFTTEDLFELVQKARQRTSVPFVLRTYANVVFSYGITPFLAKAAQVGVDGLILSDVPFEEKEEFAAICRKVGVSYISPVVPTSRERLQKIVGDAQGFVLAGAPSLAGQSLETIREYTPLPVVVTCGGETEPERLAQRVSHADGILLENAIMERIASQGDNLGETVFSYAQSVVKSVKGHSHLKKRVESPAQTRVTPTKIASSNP